MERSGGVAFLADSSPLAATRRLAAYPDPHRQPHHRSRARVMQRFPKLMRPKFPQR